MNYSSTLGYSPHPPVSVWGTSDFNKLRRFSWQRDYLHYLLARRLGVLSGFSLNGERICLLPGLRLLTCIRQHAGVSLLRHALAWR